MGDVVLMPLTSQDQNDPSLLLNQWQAAGLPRLSWIKPLIGTVANGLIERKIGRLDPRDRNSVQAALAMLIAPNWY